MIEPNPENTPAITPDELSTNKRIKQTAWMIILGSLFLSLAWEVVIFSGEATNLQKQKKKKMQRGSMSR
jgi:hypothetical protein